MPSSRPNDRPAKPFDANRDYKYPSPDFAGGTPWPKEGSKGMTPTAMHPNPLAH
jgi:hypothetical protein